jgi:hypothetical protein
VGLRNRAGKIPRVVDFESRRPRLVPFAEALVPGAKGLGLLRHPEKSPQDVHRLELVGDFAARRKLELSRLEPVESERELPIPFLEPEKSLRFQKKRPVVSDVVDDCEPLFSFGAPKPPAELLHPEKAGLGRTKHHPFIKRRSGGDRVLH